jgi:L-amino acid N-acyltransferase YncA
LWVKSVDIYSATVPERTATADTEPVSIEGRRNWFREHSPTHRPLWVAEAIGEIVGWFSFQSFYGRPAYHRTAEVSVYVAGAARRSGVGRRLLAAGTRQAPALGLRTLVGFIFAHNTASLRLFESFAFAPWGHLPRVAELDGMERDLVIVGLRARE